MIQGIYKLINNKTEQVYVGQSIDIEERFKSHMYMLKTNTHHAYKLQRMYNQYKPLKSFNMELQVLETIDKRKYLNSREDFYIELYDSHQNGYNSIGVNGDKTHTKRREFDDNKFQKITKNREKFGKYIEIYGDNIIQTRNKYNDNSMYRVNESIEYFIKNYSMDDYFAEIYQYKSKVEMKVKGIYSHYYKHYIYNTDYKCIMLYQEMQRYVYERNMCYHKPTDSKFTNRQKCKSRYIWFMKNYVKLDEDIIKYNTTKYMNYTFTIPFRDISNIIRYTGNKFRDHFVYDKDIQKISSELGITYPNGRAMLKIQPPEII